MSRCEDGAPRRWAGALTRRIAAGLRTSGNEPASGSDVPERAPDLRMVPVAVCVWTGCWCATHGPAWLAGAVILFAAALTAAIIVLRHHTGAATTQRIYWPVAAAAAGLLACVVGGLAWWATDSGPLPGWAQSQVIMRVQARVSADPVTYPARGILPAQTVVAIQVRQVEARGQTVTMRLDAQLVLASNAQMVAVGQMIAVSARASPADAGSGLALRLRQAGPLSVTGQPGPFDRAITALRAGLHDAMSGSQPDQAGLVPSLVVGDTSALPSEVVDQFRATSLSHLTAVSGTNLTLMLGFVLALARAVGVRGWWLRGLAGLAVIWFVVLCRAEPSVLRAAAMGLVALTAAGVTRDSRRGLRQLAVAVCALLLISPWMSHSWGFAMSAVATAGILWWLGRWQKAMAWTPPWLAEAICLPLAAQLATQPLVTALNGQVSAVGPFANLTAGPFVGPVTVLGLATCLVAPVSSAAAHVLGWLAGWCAEPILLAAHLGSGLPGATIPVGASAPVLAVIGVLSLIAAWGVRHVLSRAWTSALACAALVVAVLVPMPTPGWPGQWTVVFCDVGQGNAAVANVGPHAGLLVDAGPDPPALYRCLDALGVRQLPLVVLTHQHADHIDGAEGLADRYQVGEVMVRAGLSEATVAQMHQFIGSAAVPIVRASPGQRLAVGPASWTTLASGPVFQLDDPGDGDGEDPQENNASTIGLLELDGLRVLFTGDAEPEEQADVVASGLDPAVDVLAVPHHGSARQSADFITGTHAPVAVISVGADNSYGHPAPRTVSLLTGDGMRVWRTDQRGCVAIAKVDGVIQVTAQRAGP